MGLYGRAIVTSLILSVALGLLSFWTALLWLWDMYLFDFSFRFGHCYCAKLLAW